jgi:peptidoglycan L-alanyl-D-glutamate endopeptidase CwlK
VTCGLRTETEQELLVAAGKSQTMKSKHLRQVDGYSHAVDLVAYIGGSVCWELNVYDNLADAMKKAAREVGIGITWGGAWSVEDLTVFSGTAEEAMMSYIDLRRSASKRPFLDGPHFQTCGLI